MRRSFALTFASLMLASISGGLTMQGCGAPNLDVQDLCGWIDDECNCYRRFAAGVANVTVTEDAQGKRTITGQPKCGVALDGANKALDAMGATIADETTKPTFGSFPSREELTSCVLLRPEGGQIEFENLTLIPLSLEPIGFTIKDGSGNTCASGTYGSITNFSISFPAPEGAGGAGGVGGTGGTGGTGGSPKNLCLGDTPEQRDPTKEAIGYGTYSSTPTDTVGIIDTVCPDGEAHKFNLYQLEKCDGSANEESYQAILPTAEMELDPGGANKDGFIRLRVFWPPTTPGIDMNGQKPIAVEYFHCAIPGGVVPCFDKALSDGETDLDCGGVCVKGCGDGMKCLDDSDCQSKVCETDDMGFLRCVSPPCGDLMQTGNEACDDGNMNPGDGCSDTCQVEPGFTCSGAGKCQDIDECVLNMDNCPAGNKCVNTQGSFVCECGPKQSWDGMKCVDGCGDGDLQPPEACDDGDNDPGDGCTANCVREPGFFCMGEGPLSCVDIDECATMTDTCLDTEKCTNTVGSFTCECDLTRAKVCPVMGKDVCIGILDDVFNCGGCDQVCNPNNDCVEGTCCLAPADALCGAGKVCTDTQTNAVHCGGCGKACMAGGKCVAGMCCELPNTACGTECVNTQTSASHCGACDNACGPGLNCVTGKCCPAPNNTVCGGACTNTLTDVANCGTCGNVCPVAMPTCTNGTCM